MRLFLLITLFLQFTAQIISQTPQVTWGPELQKPRKTKLGSIIGHDENSFYCERYKNSIFSTGGNTLEKYSSKTLKLEYVKELRAPEVNGRKLHLPVLFLVNKKILVFYSEYYNSQNKKGVYVKKIDAEGGSIDEELKEIASVEQNKDVPACVGYFLSEDSTKVLISCRKENNMSLYSQEKLFLKLIDSETKEIWSAAIDLVYKDKYFEVEEYKVDKAGDLYMLIRVQNDKQVLPRNKLTYSYYIVKYDPLLKAIKELPLSLDDKYISDLGFVSVSKGIIKVGGFYSYQNSEGIAGSFCITVDKIKCKVLNSGYKDFTTDFFNEFTTSKKSKKYKELYDYNIKQIINQPDGGVLVVAEQASVSEVVTCNSNGVCSSSYYYVNRDIIVSSYTQEAKLKWIEHIPKLQISRNDLGINSSYLLVIVGNKLHFIYNDNPKNLELASDPRKYKNGIGKKMIAVDVEMNMSDGTYTRMSLFSAKKEKLNTQPKISLQISKNSAVFYAIKRKKFKFGIIKY